MTNPTFLKIMATLAVVSGALVSAKVLPSWAAEIAVAIGTTAGMFHPLPSSTTQVTK